tara:strand:- start:2245 stop:2490 length:246 start_codon:yes stop_codon:yes gene_type:complete
MARRFKILKKEMISGSDFYFVDMGDVVTVWFGNPNTDGDFVGAFNSKEEALKNLRKARIKHFVDGSIKIEGLKAIREDQFV